MNWLRQALLEVWAVAVLAVVVGFLGPFGTYVDATMLDRVSEWWMLLMGAYILVRPCLWALRRIARGTSLPAGALTFWGVVATSLPLAMIWRSVGQDAYRELDGYAELLPFALLCALAVLGLSRWASITSQRLGERAAERSAPMPSERLQARGERSGEVTEASSVTTSDAGTAPRLLARLSAGFQAPIIALQSEDHYVRVHGPRGSELLLMRLRDAITELDGVAGEQVHRSWWIARAGVAGMERAARTWNVRLANGELAPVARESVYRLRQSGFLPTRANEDMT